MIANLKRLFARSLPAFGVLLVALSPVAAQTPAAPDTRTFAPAAHFSKGQVSRYQSQSSITLRFPPKAGQEGGLLTVVLDTTLRYTAQETKPDGTTIFSVRSEGGKMFDAAGKSQALPKEPDNYGRAATFDKFDKLTALKDPGRSGQKGGPFEGLFNQSNLLVPLHFLPLPDKPIKIGDTWTARYPLLNAKPDDAKTAPEKAAGEDDRSAMRVTLTLLGTEKLGDQETLQVKQELSMPYETSVDAQGKPTTPERATGHVQMLLTFTQFVNILPADGQMVRTQGEIDGSIKFLGSAAAQTPGDTLIIKGKLIAVRLPDNAPAPAKEK